ncbi:oxygen-independent coproporphyrinogen III oxidase [Rheinheimera riviphila]|uniref:Coproporphyrinogen-III oxidase n=1 Tax=Rheinheimera riviphila TaxID=1834037 RepID=A0A437QG63_9GAMM|nr:oxygen-independent coproporphyrinogen III oxidase [Rheinheimera riviphila]RVU33330.1 oxygen-independent coproporphyrinogen III oxidase [Rheinheimera riviphila]
MNTMIWDEALVRKYNTKGPRYTSYPTALLLRSGYGAANALQALAQSGPELSLYLHLPFCRELCYYCGCNKVISRDQTKADRYIQALAREIQFYQRVTANKQVSQLHLGGGTPTFLDQQQLTQLMLLLRQQFNFAADAVLSIEIDPRSCDVPKLRLLRELGFSRVSFGVQDFDEKVQLAIHRQQSYQLVETLVLAARQLGFSSVNLDLVYGLPFQHPDSFTATLQQVRQLDPDRISLFSYAHLPERFAAQRKIPSEALPNAQQKLELLALSVKKLGQAGYQAIGMDHFAKAHDSLAIAQREGKLQRNFQGYTTDNCPAMLGLGVSAISQVGNQIWQQQKDLNLYYRQQLELGHSIDKGMALSLDDQIRADLIAELMCNFRLDTEKFAEKWQLDFASYFSSSLAQLTRCQQDGLVELTSQQLKVTTLGRPWVRVLAACFDAYLLPQSQQYSQVI